jgi:hypothetical protein
LDAAVAATAFLLMLGAFEGLTVEVLVDFAVVVFLAVVAEDFLAGLLVCFVVEVVFFFVVEEPEPSEAL